MKTRVIDVLPQECNAYIYGSRAYGTFDHHSDHDYQVICKSNLVGKGTQVNLRNTDLHYHTPAEFQQALDDHAMWALECFFLPKSFVLRESLKFNFKLDRKILRQSISENVSHSWVKGKKKLTVEQSFDERVGKKSLFHALRIVIFGTQIATRGRIYDYTAANDHLVALRDLPANWEVIDSAYRGIYNSLMTNFRSVCPKN